MKKIFLPLFLLVAACSQSFAQATKADDVEKSLGTANKDTVAWIHNDIFTLGINEDFLHNWSAGGELISLQVSSTFHGELTYYNHGSVWATNLDMAYGLNYLYSNNFQPRKTDDRIDLSSNYGSQLNSSKNFYYAGLFDFKSQFTHGYDYTIPDWQSNPTSGFFSPAYVTVAAGMQYKKGSDLSLFLSPIAARVVLSKAYYTSQSAQGAFGIDSGKTSVFQFGAYFSGRYQRNLNKHIFFTTHLDLYSNYLAKNTVLDGVTVKKDNPGNIQVYWDNLLSIKAYKNLSVTLGLTLVYDNNFPYSNTYLDKATGQQVTKQDPASGLGWLQVNQLFTFGIAYKF